MRKISPIFIIHSTNAFDIQKYLWTQRSLTHDTFNTLARGIMENILSCENSPWAEKPLFNDISRHSGAWYIVIYVPTWVYLGLIISLFSFVLIGVSILYRCLKISLFFSLLSLFHGLRITLSAHGSKGWYCTTWLPLGKEASCSHK